MKNLYIFDLDGTLALCEHRQHFLANKEDPDRWRKFYAACPKDEPNWPVIEVLLALHKTDRDILIFTGRSQEVEQQTIEWLTRKAHLFSLVEQKEHYAMKWRDVLLMRPEDNHTPDHELKRHWYQRWLGQRDRERLVAVFEDRDQVVQMWRSLGVTCFQVADGKF